jgi:nucleotide-binding universal stress UspA family protein
MDVLLGLDGSELSMRALDHTLERAQETGDAITVAVYDGEAGTDPDELADLAVARLEETGLEGDVRHLETDPGSQLVELAADGFGQIVLGGGTISPMGKIRLGEVVEFVLVNAQTTVTLVR